MITQVKYAQCPRCNSVKSLKNHSCKLKVRAGCSICGYSDKLELWNLDLTSFEVDEYKAVEVKAKVKHYKSMHKADTYLMHLEIERLRGEIVKLKNLLRSSNEKKSKYRDDLKTYHMLSAAM